MHDAGLGDRLRPYAFDRCGQALESIADHHADILGAPILDLGEDPGPELRTLPVAVLAGPQPQDVAGALHGHPQREVDRTVRDVAVPNLDVDRVHEDHQIHRIQGTGLPFRHALDHPVGNRGDGLLGHVRPVHLG